MNRTTSKKRQQNRQRIDYSTCILHADDFQLDNWESSDPDTSESVFGLTIMLGYLNRVLSTISRNLQCCYHQPSGGPPVHT
jgi:hypothetical protein